MKKPMKRNRKRLLKSVLHSLKSDSYMFSLLISSDFRASKMKKPMKRRNNRLLKAILDYLKSDTYLFAPLLSPPPSGFAEPRSEMKEASRADSLGMLTNVGEYLKSDSFMYGPLVAPPPVSSSPIEDSSGSFNKEINSKNNQLTNQSANEVTATCSLMKMFLKQASSTKFKTQGVREAHNSP